MWKLGVLGPIEKRRDTRRRVSKIERNLRSKGKGKGIVDRFRRLSEDTDDDRVSVWALTTHRERKAERGERDVLAEYSRKSLLTTAATV